MTQRPIRLGLIGAGRWGRNYIRAVADAPGVSLACVVSGNPETRAIVPADCDVFDDIRRLPDASAVDGVIIATPPDLHAAMTQTCLERKMAVLVEKPLTMDLEEARRLLARAQSLGGLVLVDHIYLFHPGYQTLKERAKRLGPLKRLALKGGNWGPFRCKTGPLWDYGPHDVSMCLDFTGQKPSGATAKRVESRRTAEGDGEMLALSLEFPGHVSAEISLGNLRPKRERRFEAVYAEESLVFDDTQPSSGERPLNIAVKTFARLIREGSRDLSSLMLGVDVVETLALCQGALRP